MTGKTHLAGGSFAAALLMSSIPHIEGSAAIFTEKFICLGAAIPAWIPGATVCLIASLLPDIDEPDSLIVNSPASLGKQLPKGKSAGEAAAMKSSDIALRIVRFLFRILSGIIRLLAGGHRGATHWLLVGALFTFGMNYLGMFLGYPRLWIWFAAGYASHLFLDMLTPSGLRLLRPLTSISIRLLPGFMSIRTGSSADTAVRLVLYIAAIGLLYKPLFGY